MQDNVTTAGTTVQQGNETLREITTDLDKINAAEQARLMLLMLDDML